MSATAEVTWWPSPFGEDDQLGMLNHIDDAKRLEALSLVRSGRVYDLGRVLDETVPVFPGRYFRQTLVTTAHHTNAGAGMVGENKVNWVTELVAGTMQLGTHLDALSHLQRGDRAYNGWSVAQLASDTGVRCLGVETVPQIVTRGWLVDVSDRDPGPGYPIGLDYPEYENTMLVAITEKRSKEQIDLFAKSLASAVAASNTGVGAEA